MRVKYLRGYEPAMCLDIVAVSAEECQINFIPHLVLFDKDGILYDAVYLDEDIDQELNTVFTAGLPENW